MTDPEGNETDYQYDADGDLIATILENYNGDNANAAGTAAERPGRSRSNRAPMTRPTGWRA